MQNWERSEFDEQWKDALGGAEVPPSASVWANVDRELTLADNTEGKRRIIFYQRLAAACILFAVAAGSFGVYYWRQSESSLVQLKPGIDVQSQKNPHAIEKNSSSQSGVTDTNASAENKATPLNSGKTTEVTEPPKSSANELNIRSQDQTAVATGSLAERGSTKLNLGKTTEVAAQSKSPETELSISQNQRTTTGLSTERRRANDEHQVMGKTGDEKILTVAENTSMIDEKSLAGRNNESILPKERGEDKTNYTWLTGNVDLPALELLPISEIQGEPRFTEIYRKLPYIPAAFMSEERNKKFEHEKLWASVTAASGAYAESLGASYNSPAALRIYTNAVAQYAPSATVTNAVASTGPVPTVGKSFSYGVIGGVRLAERWVLQTGVQYLNQTMGSATSQYANYGSGSLISTNEFVSVPLQAGYLLINRKIGWQLNPGVSTDFFVRNTLSNQQQSVSQGAGVDSPYRSVNFAGLMSSEFSYKLGKNYRLSVVPGVRYAINPALKSTATGGAIAWDLGFRFRYIFK